MRVNQRDPDPIRRARKHLLFDVGDLVGDGRKLEAGVDSLADRIGSPPTSVRRLEDGASRRRVPGR